jgi:hypothetical protein
VSPRTAGLPTCRLTPGVQLRDGVRGGVEGLVEFAGRVELVTGLELPPALFRYRLQRENYEERRLRETTAKAPAESRVAAKSRRTGGLGLLGHCPLTLVHSSIGS